MGTQHFILNDRPAGITQRKLGSSMLAALTGNLAAAVLAVAVAAAAGAQDLVPDSADPALVAASAAAATACLWPLLGPLCEVSKFADMSATEVEEAVRVKQPIQEGDLSKPLKLFGEDALLDWPGVLQPLIQERDAFMAKALAAAATAQQGFSPAFVRDMANGQVVWRLMMPEEAPAACAPSGLGDGAYAPLPGVRSVVAVVGSAHAKGMCRDWQQHLQSTDPSELLKP